MKKMVSKISVDEQEVSINFLRKDDLAEIYVSDNTWITKLEKLCQKSPDLYKKVNETEWGSTYTFPKRLLSLRSCIKTVSFTEEQKQEKARHMRDIAKKKRENL